MNGAQKLLDTRIVLRAARLRSDEYVRVCEALRTGDLDVLRDGPMMGGIVRCIEAGLLVDAEDGVPVVTQYGQTVSGPALRLIRGGKS